MNLRRGIEKYFALLQYMHRSASSANDYILLTWGCMRRNRHEDVEHIFVCKWVKGKETIRVAKLFSVGPRYIIQGTVNMLHADYWTESFTWQLNAFNTNCIITGSIATVQNGQRGTLIWLVNVQDNVFWFSVNCPEICLYLIQCPTNLEMEWYHIFILNNK